LRLHLYRFDFGRGKIREPDILFVANEHQDRIGEKVFGVPDLVVEVISPATHEVDRGEKFFEYAQAGVREYWLVDPKKHTVEVYVLQGRAYEPLGKFGSGERARSEIIPGFEVEVDELFQR